MKYPGGKGASGVYQRLINRIPPHRVYVETHLGGGAVMRHKRQADINLGLDIDSKVVAKWENHSFVQAICQDAVTFLRKYSFKGDEFIYSDPPYLSSLRRSDRPIYSFEYTEAQHAELLGILVRLPCRVMISGYWSKLYAELLSDWETMSFNTRTRSGEIAKEWVWMNYPRPDELHDYHYLGEDYRERERIQRRIARWRYRFEGLSLLERKALITALEHI
jgi:site-specific DNA-adenine methylase